MLLLNSKKYCTSDNIYAGVAIWPSCGGVCALHAFLFKTLNKTIRIPAQMSFLPLPLRNPTVAVGSRLVVY